jgi:hypothetical protein
MLLTVCDTPENCFFSSLPGPDGYWLTILSWFDSETGSFGWFALS